MLCLHDSIRDDGPAVQRLLSAVEDAHSLPAFIRAAWQVARVLTVRLVKTVLAERARRLYTARADAPLLRRCEKPAIDDAPPSGSGRPLPVRRPGWGARPAGGRPTAAGLRGQAENTPCWPWSPTTADTRQRPRSRSPRSRPSHGAGTGLPLLVPRAFWPLV